MRKFLHARRLQINKFIQRVCINLQSGMGASAYDRKLFRLFAPCPLPACPLVCIGQLIYTIKFTQPPLLCLLFGMPLPVQTSYFTCPLIKPDILLWHCSPYPTIYLPVLWATPSSWSRTPRPTRPWRSLPPKRTWPSRPSWRAARGRRPPRCRTHHRLRRHPHHCSRRRGTLLVFNRIVAKNRFSARPRTVG